MRVILWGGTGQAKVLRPILERQGHEIAAVVDRDPTVAPPWPGASLLAADAFDAWLGRERRDLGFAVAIGTPHGGSRSRVYDRLIGGGLEPVSVVHEGAFVEEDAIVGRGVQILGQAFIGAVARIGENCLVNSAAIVDHECVLHPGAVIAPGATLGGLVEVGPDAFVGIGATVLPRVRIGAGAVVAAGAVVTRDVASKTTVIGVPARARPHVIV